MHRPAPTLHRVRAILIGGLLAGVGDLVFAVLYYEAPWHRIARSVAGGVLGREAAAVGGEWVVLWGMILHFIIAGGAAAGFVIAGRWITVLERQPGLAGLGYGVVVYFVMNWIVIPLSALTVPDYPPDVDPGALVGHMVVVGLPIALANRWFGARGHDRGEAEASS